MHSDAPKVLHRIAGRALLAHVLDAAAQLSPHLVCVVHGFGGKAVREAVGERGALWVVQEPQLGTGHAVMQAVPHLNERWPTLVLYGDVPLIRPETLRRLIEAAVDDLGSPRAGTPTLDRALAFMACRAAVKAETPLALEEMERIVGDLAATTAPYFCPHGRPIVSRVSLADIRKELRRTW